MSDPDRDAVDRFAEGEAPDATARGDEPFGTVLVRDGEVIAECRNAVVTADDVTAHPEFDLAQWAAAECSPAERAATTMYTSTEPCPMCAGAIRLAGLGRVVYSTGQRALADLLGGDPATRCAEIVDAETTVDGPVLPDEGLAVHEAYWDRAGD